MFFLKVFPVLVSLAACAVAMPLQMQNCPTTTPADCNLGIDPEVTMSPEKLITCKGYPCQTAEVTTDDGYILTVYRIPHGVAGPGNETRPVVFLQHGLLCSCTNWITNLANESLGFILADAGMDVWLGNFRGNTYSTKHTTLDVNKHKYWEFSWDEMAKYDLPAMLNFALSVSGEAQLYYVGHSEGTMTAFAQFSQDLSFGSKIAHFFALAPVAKVEHAKGLMGILGHNSEWFDWLIKLVDNNDFLPSDDVTKVLAKLVCGDQATNPLCDDILFLIAGPESHQLNSSRVPVYIGHTPAGTSTQNMIHFAQNCRDGKYGMYDYGYLENLRKYHQATPPQYHPENMATPVSLFSGDADWLADPQDVVYLTNTLKSIKYQVILKDFNHLDFIWGLRAPKEVYAEVIKTIKTGN